MRPQSSDLSKFTKKTFQFPATLNALTNLKQNNENERDFFPIDLSGMFFLEVEETRMLLKKVLSLLGIKTMINSNSAFVCEKNLTKFEFSVFPVQNDYLSGSIIGNKKKQGNNYSYREIVNSVFKKINEFIEKEE